MRLEVAIPTFGGVSDAGRAGLLRCGSLYDRRLDKRSRLGAQARCRLLDQLCRAAMEVDEQAQLIVAVAGAEVGKRMRQHREKRPELLLASWFQGPDQDATAVFDVVLTPDEAFAFETVDDAGDGAGGQAGLARKLAGRQGAGMDKHVEAFMVGSVEAEAVGDCIVEEERAAALTPGLLMQDSEKFNPFHILVPLA